jgi:phage tail-like protein
MNNRYSWPVKLVLGGLLAATLSACYFGFWDSKADAKGAQGDPLVTAWFSVQVEGKASGAFASCAGIGSANEAVEARAAAVRAGEVRGADVKPASPKGIESIGKNPGPLHWHDVVLTRGMTEDRKFWDWRQEVVTGKIASARQKCTITMFNQEGKTIAIWELANAWPISLTIGAKGGNSMVTEEVVLAHEGVTRKQ